MVVDAFAYEGTFTPVDGAAIGISLPDIGVAESSSTPAGFSLQRIGTGSSGVDFTFATEQAETPGAVNTGQIFELPASFELQISEIWPGNEPGDNLTADWFEITNVGTAPWSSAADGTLSFDDESASPVDAVPLTGVSELMPGESAVFVDDDTPDAFTALWSEVISLGQVGTYDGAGLSQDGDAVALFLDSEGDGVEDDDLIDLESYPDANADGGRSWEPADIGAGAFSVPGTNGTVATLVLNDADQPAVGSPTDGTVVPTGSGSFTLEILHVTDQEASASAIVDAPNLSAVLNALRAQDLGNDGIADNTLTLSSGDAFIPGVFFDASEAVFGTAGIADFQIQNELGVEAIAFGNHEFDEGTGLLASLIDGSAEGDFTALVGSTLEGLDFQGALFPYQSTNLDVSTDPNLAPLELVQRTPVNGASMADGENGWIVTPIFSVGETIDDYTPPGILDGLGAYQPSTPTRCASSPTTSSFPATATPTTFRTAPVAPSR